jgi:hypothetical protein
VLQSLTNIISYEVGDTPSYSKFYDLLSFPTRSNLELQDASIALESCHVARRERGQLQGYQNSLSGNRQLEYTKPYSAQS